MRHHIEVPALEQGSASSM